MQRYNNEYKFMLHRDLPYKSATQQLLLQGQRKPGTLEKKPRRGFSICLYQTRNSSRFLRSFYQRFFLDTFTLKGSILVNLLRPISIMRSSSPSAKEYKASLPDLFIDSEALNKNTRMISFLTSVAAVPYVSVSLATRNNALSAM